MSKRITCLRCRRDRVSQGRGLCKACVTELRENGDLELYPVLKPGPQPQPEDDAFPGAWVRRGHVYYPVQEAS